MGDLHISVVIPAYNEEHRIASTIEAIADYLGRQKYGSEIIVVNDGSTDGTEQVLRELKEKHRILRVISYEENRGKGCAVRQGIMSAMGNFILFTDADLNTPIEEVQKLFEGLEAGADIAIGSRGKKGAKIAARRPWLRQIGSRMLNLAIRMLAVPGISDTQCGFKLFRSKAARDIFSRTFLDRFSFDIEVLYLARRLGYRVIELPVTWFYRGGSKVRPIRDGLGFLRDIVRIRLHDYHIAGSPEAAA